MSADLSQRVLGRDPSTGRGIAVTVEGGTIKAIEFVEHGEKQWLSAGFVDLQVNGYAGFDLNALALDIATVRALCQAMLKVGVTTFLPTLITAPEARITAAAMLAPALAPQAGAFGHAQQAGHGARETLQRHGQRHDDEHEEI